MLEHVGAAWRTQLDTPVPNTNRYYADFRQLIYPPQSGHDLTYTLITSAANQPGSHNLTGGNARYFLSLPSILTIEARVKPTFAYNVATNQPIWSWYIDATHYLTLYYSATNDKYELKWKDGTNERLLAQPTAYLNDVTLQVWTDITCTLDLTTGTTAGSVLYINEVAEDNVWSGNIDVKASNFPLLEIRSENSTEGAYTINYVRMFSNKVASATDIGNRYKSVEDEEIYWYFNGEGCGRTRCNISKYVMSETHEKSAENEAFNQTANRMMLELNNIDGTFTDDKYAAYAPASNSYNGIAAQKYLQDKCGVIVETWYGDDFEPLFVGNVSEEYFKRETEVGMLPTVTIECEDRVAELARINSQYPVSYDSYNLCNPASEATSLIHTLVRLVSRRKVKNYVANSSFENATIALSWTVAGAGATFVKAAGGLFGGNEGQLDYAAALCSASQTVTFTGTKSLNKYDTYTFSIYLSCAGAVSDASSLIKLGEKAGAVIKDSTTTAIILTGGESWKRFDVTHTITDATSDRLTVYIQLNEAVVLSCDCAMLTQGKRAHNWFVLNNNNGAAGVESADDADTDEYDTMGFDVDTVAITHPWVYIGANKSIWEYVKDIGNATITQYLGLTASGTFRYRSPFKTGYTDPSSLLTVTAPYSMITNRDSYYANKILITGCYIVKETIESVLWTATSSGVWPLRNILYFFEIVANGATFPSPATLGEFWAKYVDVKIELLAKTPRILTDFDIITMPLSGLSQKTNSEILGATGLRLGYVANYIDGRRAILTQTIFDITTRMDSARILLTNNTGSDVAMLGLTIFGKKILRKDSNNGGYIHDSLFDEESIQKHGIIQFQLKDNNMVATKAQVEQLADWWWKYLKDRKHAYEVRLRGARYYFEPGNWYVLDTAYGDAEDVNVLCRCKSVSIEQMPGEIGETVLVLQEVLEDWAKTINAPAYYSSSGYLLDSVPTNKIVVASSMWGGPADYYCDGTADQTEINQAITDLISASGGGTIELTEGTFYITAAIEMNSNIVLQGRGNQTILERNCNDYCVECIGVVGTYKSGIGIRDLKLTINAADTNNIAIVEFQYVKNSVINNIEFDALLYTGLEIKWGTRITIDGLRNINGAENTDPTNVYAIYFTGTHGSTRCEDILITNSIINSFYGRAIRLNNDVYNASIKNNTISNCWGHGIRLDYVYHCDIASNQIYDNGIYILGEGGIILGYATESKFVSLLNNILTGNRTGIRVSDFAIDTFLEGNNLANNGNLIFYADCESVVGWAGQGVSIDGISLSNSTWTRNTDEHHHGVASGKLTITATGSEGIARQVDNTTTTDMHTLLAGQTYRYKVWVKIPSIGGPAAAEVKLRFSYYHLGAWRDTESIATVQDAWELLDCGEVPVLSTATGIKAEVLIDGAASNGEYCYFDDFRLQPIGISNQHGQNLYVSNSSIRTNWH